MLHLPSCFLVFFFNDTATTEIYTLSLHDALRSRWSVRPNRSAAWAATRQTRECRSTAASSRTLQRSEEHTSELQSHSDLVCRLLLEKKKIHITYQSADPHIDLSFASLVNGNHDS